MKMYMIIYDAGYDEDVNETLVGCCITGFTKWTQVMEKGEKTVPKMNDSVWPGYNCAIMMAVAEPEEPDIKKALDALYDSLGSKGLRVYTWGIEQVL